MKIIDESGNYKMIEGTRTVETSDHPVYQARIEVALGLGKWPYAANRGHQLAKFNQADQTEVSMEEFRKELLLYLDRYDPVTRSILGERGAVTMNLEISKDALNVSDN